MIQLFAGHAISDGITSHWFLRCGAQALLIATRILDCVKAQKYLRNSYDAWSDSIRGDYVAIHEIKWIAKSDGIISPSTTLWASYLSASLKERIQRVVFTTLQLCVAIFALSMRIMDAIDAVTWTPESQRDAALESCVNSAKWIKEAIENKEELLEELDNNRALVEYILKVSPYTYEMVYNGISGSIDTSSNIKNRITNFFAPITGLLGGK